MFDVGFSELLLLAIVALVVLGPEKLPHAARMTGAWVGRIRRTILSVQAEIENEVAASEMRARIQAELERAKSAMPDLALDENRIAPPRPASDTATDVAPAPVAEPESPATVPDAGVRDSADKVAPTTSASEASRHP